MALVGGRMLCRNLLIARTNSPVIRSAIHPKCKASNTQVYDIVVRGMAGGGTPKMYIKSSRYTDTRFLRAARFYFLLTGVPVLTFATLVNVFIGEAEYAEIPEGYEPKHWEYHKHPITRWLSRNLYPSPQQDYEKMAHYMEIEGEKMKARGEEREVRRLMRARGEGHYYYAVDTPPNWKSEEEMKE
ncbi:NADH dehydrogenase [ubiquinone] 1 beta subcomplex subunit 5, mitochondrial-like [Diadema antillarum]|uniref:NADH dehydrogenase [ubiquinone] 1 beta subcomplex subunit 5, mitochondrial-like n=1 Tax=Diadema antillarum TaxID=105358 RepID=UPI003A839CDF